MFFLNYWIFFALIPLYFIYKKHRTSSLTQESKLLYITLVFLFIAVARPVLPNAPIKQKFHSQDFIIALDASYSMQANDLQPSRYALAKEAIKKLMLLHKKDRFTLFIFTSNALLISPPTTDTSISFTALETINPNYILTKSTSIANLFKTIATLPMQEKKLIIFSDGGDEHDVEQLSQIALLNNITPYILATASKKGAALRKDDHYIKREDASLVISKINPSLKPLADATDGKYYELTSLDIIDKLSKDITQSSLEDREIKLQSYQELFVFPLSIALLLFFLSITKFGNFFMLLSLIFFLPQKIDASLLDFYHIHQATNSYQNKKYKDALFEYKKVSPSVSSYYNIGVCYYRLEQYKKALFYFTKIQTPKRSIKQKLLYNIANSAFRLKKYNMAKKLYLQALAFSSDKDALYNLRLIQKYHLKTAQDVTKLLAKKEPQTEKKTKEQTSKKEQNKKDSASNTHSKQQSQESSNGGGGDKKKKVQSHSKKKTEPKHYKIGYKAYEKINKGYSNEKEPW